MSSDAHPVTAVDLTLAGHAGALHVRRWRGHRSPRWVVLLCHGYGEHVGRYEWLADQLVQAGAVVWALDHVGHGSSAGEPVLVSDFGDVVADLGRLHARAAAEHHPGLPVVLVGHSMGGMIAARYAQLHGEELCCVVLSGPVLGSWAPVRELLGVEQIPDTPIDVSTLSRDPEVGRVYEADPLVWHGPFKPATVAALDRALQTITDSGAVQTAPVLWLHGEDDTLVPMVDTAAGWATLAGPGSEARSYPGARHEIFNETNREEVVADVLAFVGQHLPVADR